MNLSAIWNETSVRQNSNKEHYAPTTSSQMLYMAERWLKSAITLKKLENLSFEINQKK